MDKDFKVAFRFDEMCISRIAVICGKTSAEVFYFAWKYNIKR